jgi:V/A-type H+/Na+-transporting ATPase subunit I
MIRPEPARWFEIVVARDDAFVALEAMAAAACVEVEWHTAPLAGPSGGVQGDLLKDITTLTRTYRAYWPVPARHLDAERRAPADVLAAATQALKDWAAAAEPLIRALQQAEAAVGELSMTQAALKELACTPIDVSALARADHGVTAALFALPVDVALDIPDALLARSGVVGPERLIVAVGPADAIESTVQRVAELNGRRARLPDWLEPTVAANLTKVGERLAAQHEVAIRLRTELDALSAARGVPRALGEIARATWCVEHGGAIDDGEVFARITGWSVDPAALIRAIEQSGTRVIVEWPRAPRGARAPMILRNPWWARPFEVFTRLVGMPGESGADPSVLLAFAVPLIFGYMFGDVGQGLVLVIAGLLLRNRMPVLRLLVPGGLAAMAFGVVFGSVFSLEGVIHPLWVAPLERPLPVLMAPIAGGAVLLMLGLLLDGLQAWWHRQTLHWAREELPVILVYSGIALAIFHPTGPWLAVAGVVLAVLAALLHTGRLLPALGALGGLFEHTVQLLINTLSFARVGAFALAHAGLSSAVVALADAVSSPALHVLVLVLGNVLIVLIEGLVVSIQTTRLVLFEFFTRFFKAEGREFRPLAPPPVTQ